MKKIEAFLLIVALICISILIIRNVFIKKDTIDTPTEDTETKIEVIIHIKTMGEYGYSKQKAIQDAFWIELMGRLWNRYPEERKWIKKYIQAMVGSQYEIDENKKIMIDTE